MVWREQRTVTSALTLHYNKAMFILEPCELTRALARQRVTVCEYPDDKVEIQHEGRILPYSVFDKMRQVNQTAVVDNKHLDAALALARQMQATAPHHRQRNNDAPSRRSRAKHIFPELEGLPKIDGRRSGNAKLKRHPRLSDAEHPRDLRICHHVMIDWQGAIGPHRCGARWRPERWIERCLPRRVTFLNGGDCDFSIWLGH